MEFPRGLRARDQNRIKLGGRLGGGIEKHGGVTDPIRPVKSGRREGGEASRTPQIRWGSQETRTFSRVPIKTWPDGTLGSRPRAQVPRCPEHICTCWELNTETHPLPRTTLLGTEAGVLPSGLELNQAQHSPWASPKVRLGFPVPMVTGTAWGGVT